MKHIAIFNNSGDVQTALNEETLINPYVAKVSGALDYDTLSPVSPGPVPLGEWTYDGNLGFYNLQILDTDPTKWENMIQIATLTAETQDYPVYMSYVSGENNWRLLFGDISDSESIDVRFNPDYRWDEAINSIIIGYGEDSSDVYPLVTWEASETTFIFYSSNSDVPLLMTTITPEYPDEGPSD